jgi:hypothetical protein
MLISYPMWLQGIIKLLHNYKLEQDECQYLPLLIDKYGTFWHFIREKTCIIFSSAMYINVFKILCGLD